MRVQHCLNICWLASTMMNTSKCVRRFVLSWCFTTCFLPPCAFLCAINTVLLGTRMLGSEHNDEFYVDEKGAIRTRTNRSGGIQASFQALTKRAPHERTPHEMRDPLRPLQACGVCSLTCRLGSIQANPLTHWKAPSQLIPAHGVDRLMGA